MRRLPYLNHERTRHGKLIWVVRIGKGPRTRLRDDYGSPEFLAAYHAAGLPGVTTPSTLTRVQAFVDEVAAPRLTRYVSGPSSLIRGDRVPSDDRTRPQ
jgi:hypothetical protein